MAAAIRPPHHLRFLPFINGIISFVILSDTWGYESQGIFCVSFFLIQPFAPQQENAIHTTAVGVQDRQQ